MNKIAESGVNKGLNLVKETVQVLFIDFTGIRREESFSLDETLPTLQVMRGTTLIISM